MKAFDLGRAKAGDAVVTASGMQARIICFDRDGALSIIALVRLNENDCEVVFHYDLDGKNGDDPLHMAPVIKQAWVNVFMAEAVFMGQTYTTKEEAEQRMVKEENKYYIKTILLHEWED